MSSGDTLDDALLRLPGRVLRKPDNQPLAGSDLHRRVKRIEDMLGISESEFLSEGSAGQTRGVGVEVDGRSSGSELAVDQAEAVSVNGTKYHLSVGDEGQVREPSRCARHGGALLITLQLVYHGLTSLAQGSTLSDDPQPPILDAPLSRNDHDPNANANANANSLIEPSFAPFFQVLAASKHVSVAPEIGNALLDCFFCYSSPLYNVVQRSIFLRTHRIASHRIALQPAIPAMV
jgi:hypothetical protein